MADKPPLQAIVDLHLQVAKQRFKNQLNEFKLVFHNVGQKIKVKNDCLMLNPVKLLRGTRWPDCP